MDKDISYVAFESVCARFERTIREGGRNNRQLDIFGEK